MYPVFWDQNVVISGDVAKAMYLNAAVCFSFSAPAPWDG
jgi:hypothetical protein